MNNKLSMKKDNSLFIEHMLDAVLAIEEFTKDVSYNDFCSSRLIKDAVIRNFEILGEAANNIEKEVITENDSIPWVQIISMRNLLIHEYFAIDDKIVWDTIVIELPKLKEQLQTILGKNVS